jgi:transcriptional regulator with XRE-family HTH domain
MSRTAYSIHPRKDDREFIDDDVYAKRFSWKLRTVLNSSGISRDEICERTGISNAALSGYVNGKQSPTAPRIVKLAKVLKCSVEELLNVDEWDM